MKFKFAVIGDSLAQGFQSGAVADTEWSFPAILARALGLRVGTEPHAEFRVPKIPGAGLPLSLTSALGAVADCTGDDIRWWEFVRVPIAIRAHLRRLKKYYEAEGSGPTDFGGVFHNLGMYGLTTHECHSLDGAACAERIAATPNGGGGLFPIATAARYRAARMVLNPAQQGDRDHATQLDNLEYLVRGNRDFRVEREPLDALIVWLGSNDCLQTVVQLELRDMPEAGVVDDAERAKYNLTAEAQFARDFNKVAERISSILDGTRTRVYVGNVPDITIPPIAKGFGKFDPDTKLFAHYGRFFLDDDEWALPFKTLSFAEARTIQQRIGAYNAHIERVVKARGWKVVDTAKALSILAVRRNEDCANLNAATPLARLLAYSREFQIDNHPLTRVAPVPSVLMLKTDSAGKRVQGGLVSLDGVHPSTIGYGIAAEGFLKRMQIDFPSIAHAKVPWRNVIAADATLQAPPVVWDDLRNAMSSIKPGADLLFRSVRLA